MELIYAALLLHKSSSEINEENLKKVMESAGAKVDDTKVKALVAALDGVDIEKAIKEAAIVSAAPSSEGGEAKAEEKKEEKEEEKKDEGQAAAGLGALFG
ncbi:50S ribosomal protein P1 [Candidatus Woesearchaeota archaeon]|jgi:large subunit ribosomal protein L12|nr:50S ribosomal protein P1 [Candidatus Woesearchaeota archaeon]MBT4322226.1 50S ribosomal protein P1 [Candidatus Woesearchaeota archaeon]MBT4631246.1 50S ribosomal protein P1 [Candidatus Woesearchaeota archaeon]